MGNQPGREVPGVIPPPGLYMHLCEDRAEDAEDETDQGGRDNQRYCGNDEAEQRGEQVHHVSNYGSHAFIQRSCGCIRHERGTSHPKREDRFGAIPLPGAHLLFSDKFVCHDSTFVQWYLNLYVVHGREKKRFYNYFRDAIYTYECSEMFV